ncbi:DUF4188 domain-containing protein [Virgibacillus sp. NKC19-3]|uniref:DUF4188 domain-containing protein n=1 Tax=Virgibacillus saliphilus TaxID=2831674 RepID=UPI001C9AD628|nr:DUF4188 domain-containing protein [Virgibacillus sp. NKC19-3]MBY7145108.1 DUF4188 domain-containing protein [Virgibacillus sp. NKC19-3]
MGKTVYEGRYTTENDQSIVVFLIGMRVNKRRAIGKWLPVFTAMPGMIRELYENKEELGFLSMENFFGLRTTVMIQYWRSNADLLAYARGQKHLTAWKNFNQKVGDTDAVGIYHETYIVPQGNYESIYGNMPLHGIGKAAKHMPVTGETISAKKRLASNAMPKLSEN